MLLLLLAKALPVNKRDYSKSIKGLITIQSCVQAAIKLTAMYVLRDDNYDSYTERKNAVNPYTNYPACELFFPQLNILNKYLI